MICAVSGLLLVFPILNFAANAVGLVVPPLLIVAGLALSGVGVSLVRPGMHGRTLVVGALRTALLCGGLLLLLIVLLGLAMGQSP